MKESILITRKLDALRSEPTKVFKSKKSAMAYLKSLMKKKKDSK